MWTWYVGYLKLVLMNDIITFCNQLQKRCVQMIIVNVKCNFINIFIKFKDYARDRSSVLSVKLWWFSVAMCLSVCVMTPASTRWGKAPCFLHSVCMTVSLRWALNKRNFCHERRRSTFLDRCFNIDETERPLWLSAGWFLGLDLIQVRVVSENMAALQVA